MEKRLTTIIMLFIVSLAAFNITAQAQKYALLDMEYILKNIPAYERANEQLSQVSKKWQAEVEALNTEAATLYRNYQNEIVFLSQEQKKARQEAIMQKEKQQGILMHGFITKDVISIIMNIGATTLTGVALLISCRKSILWNW